MFPGAFNKFIHPCPADHKPGTDGYFKCQKCCKECFSECVCHIRYCKKCGKDCAYQPCECVMSKSPFKKRITMGLKEKMDESQKKFDECVENLKKIEDELVRLNNLHKQVHDEALIWKGKYNGFKEISDEAGASAGGNGSKSEESARILEAPVGGNKSN